MKLLETAGKTVKTAAAAVAKAVSSRASSHRCGFNCDCERKAEVNEQRGGQRWLGPRRGGWLR